MVMRLALPLLLLTALCCLQGGVFAADAYDDVNAYLQSVAHEIRGHLTSADKIQNGATVQLGFEIPSYGGKPNSIETTEPGDRTWGDLVKKKLKDCDFARFKIQEPKSKHKADKLHVNSLITYRSDNPDEPVGIKFVSAEPQMDQPIWRIGAIVFSFTVAACAGVCILVQTIIVLIGGFSLGLEWMKSRSKPAS